MNVDFLKCIKLFLLLQYVFFVSKENHKDRLVEYFVSYPVPIIKHFLVLRSRCWMFTANDVVFLLYKETFSHIIQWVTTDSLIKSQRDPNVEYLLVIVWTDRSYWHELMTRFLCSSLTNRLTRCKLAETLDFFLLNM